MYSRFTLAQWMKHRYVIKNADASPLYGEMEEVISSSLTGRSVVNVDA